MLSAGSRCRPGLTGGGPDAPRVVAALGACAVEGESRFESAGCIDAAGEIAETPDTVKLPSFQVAREMPRYRISQ